MVGSMGLKSQHDLRLVSLVLTATEDTENTI